MTSRQPPRSLGSPPNTVSPFTRRVRPSLPVPAMSHSALHSSPCFISLSQHSFVSLSKAPSRDAGPGRGAPSNLAFAVPPRRGHHRTAGDTGRHTRTREASYQSWRSESKAHGEFLPSATRRHLHQHCHLHHNCQRTAGLCSPSHPLAPTRPRRPSSATQPPTHTHRLPTGSALVPLHLASPPPWAPSPPGQPQRAQTPTKVHLIHGVTGRTRCRLSHGRRPFIAGARVGITGQLLVVVQYAVVPSCPRALVPLATPLALESLAAALALVPRAAALTRPLLPLGASIALQPLAASLAPPPLPPGTSFALLLLLESLFPSCSPVPWSATCLLSR